MENDLIILRNKNAKTDSLIVADRFEKKHHRVIRKIEELIKNDIEHRTNFGEIFYKDSYGRDQKMYEMNRRDFSLLVMGFTGKKAMKWKHRFLDAFEAMERALLQQQNLSWQQLRLDGKQIRYELTDEIRSFIDYAASQGSKSAKMYYIQITKMTNQALFLIGRKAPQGFRDMLDNMQLSFLQTAEFVARNALREGMDSEMHYKDIYGLARDKVKAFAVTVGQTSVPAGIEGKKESLRLSV